jgi:hypothetical protein
VLKLHPDFSLPLRENAGKNRAGAILRIENTIQISKLSSTADDSETP